MHDMPRRTGRPPKTIALHRLQGSFERGKHGKRAEVEPIPAGDLPPPPDWLDPTATAIWKELIPFLVAGAVGGSDLHLMATYCEQASIHMRSVVAQRSLDHGKDLPFLTRARDGSAVVSPFIRLIRQTALAMAQLGADLGIGPTARARIGGLLLGQTPGTAPTEAEDPWSAFAVIQGGRRAP